VAAPRPPVSRNQLDQAGTRVRRAAEAGEPVAESVRETIAAFRDWHVGTGFFVEEMLVAALHSRTNLSQEQLPITSRAKTPDAILAKLRRQPTSLARMQDIAGSRVVVLNLELQDLVLDVVHMLYQAEHVATDDSREHGDRLGYRAVHVIVRVDGRLAEIQVRTRLQDRWAQLVEAMDDAGVRVILDHVGPGATIEDVRRVVDYKHGVGDDDELGYLLELSTAIRELDLGNLDVPLPTPPWEEQG
jgi:ppGpp synthetase/RelA/SpoT-type nucleotidyltranferase